MRKPTFCICKNKDAEQLRGNRVADQRLCFRYTDSTILLLPKFEISSLQPSPVAVQPCWSETPKTGFLKTRLILKPYYRTYHLFLIRTTLIFWSRPWKTGDPTKERMNWSLWLLLAVFLFNPRYLTLGSSRVAVYIS